MGEKGLRRGVLALGCVLATAAMAPAARAESFFSSSSFLNTPLAADAPLDPSSTTMVADLNRQVQTQINDTDVHDDPNVSYNHCTTPVYRVPAGQPGKYVTLVGENAGRADMQSQLTAVPIPDGATADTSCSDSWLMVYQQSTDTLWELAGASYDSATGAWTAIGGAQMGPNRGGLGVSQSLGFFDNHYGVSGTGLALLAGLQTIPDLQSGTINHMVSFGMKAPKACWRYPAQKQDRDTSSSSPLAPPEGAILRLPANLDIASLNLPPYVAMLARAVQKYGMILHDRAGGTVFWAEESPTGDPYTGPNGFFGGLTSRQAAQMFPWSRLQVLAVAPGHSACQTS